MKALSRPILGSAAMRRRRAAVGNLGAFPVGLGTFFNVFFAFWISLVVGMLLYIGKLSQTPPIPLSVKFRSPNLRLLCLKHELLRVFGQGEPSCI